jgi:hypothetical protein
MIKQLISAAQNKNKRRLRETEEIEETNEDGSNEATEDEEAVEEEEVEFQTGTSQRGQPVLWFEGNSFSIIYIVYHKCELQGSDF